MAFEVDFNEDFELAMEFIEQGASVFITGKAGTGKSTLLSHFLNITKKRALVVAPTGVAALNVGGTTIHSLFSFPSSITVDEVQSSNYFPRSTYKTLRQLETLVVDEVSMVRADLLDAMDAALRRFGPRPGMPFGGVQMIFVGDPYQLPPVVLDSEERFFRSRYSTPFFFSADCFRDLDYEIVQLEKVYRQSDSKFVSLLNALRTGNADFEVYDTLNERVNLDFEPPDDEFWVTLTTTNAMAQSVNSKRLESIEAERIVVQATSWGEITAKDFPTAEALEFKVGAQVMLLNNGGFWVNGSMGVIRDFYFEEDEPVVIVQLLDDDEFVEVYLHKWEVLRPIVEKGKLIYEVIGSFEQLPFKLAWAVTIHKSQGKTLERVIVSLGRGTFAEGQLYVALSRCTSLEGLVLKSVVKPHHVKVEREVTRFLNRKLMGESERDEVSIASIGIHTTGVSRFDKIIELAAVITRPDGTVERYSSLINPMRDVGNVESHGLSAAILSSSPGLPDAWPFFARRLSGCVIVAHGLPLIQTMIERECAAAGVTVDLGLGVDTQAYTGHSLDDSLEELAIVPSLDNSAAAIALKTKMVLDVLDVKWDSTQPYIASNEANGFGRIQSRSDLGPDYSSLTQWDPELTYSDRAVVLVGLGADEDESRSALEELATSLKLNPESARRLNAQVLEHVIQAVKRDLMISERERIELARASSILGLEIPPLEETLGGQMNLDDLLLPGAQICFTGNALDVDGQCIERSYLEELARDQMLKPVKSVTKKCVAVIAADTSSMSGKAKKAREQGVHVSSVADFLKWLSAVGGF